MNTYITKKKIKPIHQRTPRSESKNSQKKEL